MDLKKYYRDHMQEQLCHWLAIVVTVFIIVVAIIVIIVVLLALVVMCGRRCYVSLGLSLLLLSSSSAAAAAAAAAAANTFASIVSSANTEVGRSRQSPGY